MSRRLWSIAGNTQMLDGGAMFGNAPKALWARWLAPDDRNRIPLACRALLVQEASGRTILLETGIGAFFEPKLRDRFGVQEANHVLLESLAAAGFAPGDIDVIALSHLHFDHAGGLLTPWAEGRDSELVFPGAKLVVSRAAWERAEAPHPRDRASYIPRLQALLRGQLDRGLLEIVDGDASQTLGPDYRLHYSEGHTPGLMLVEVPGGDGPDGGPDNGPIVFAGDLIPGVPWVHAPITMGYDRFPERLIDEKTALLTDLVSRGGRLFFTHDPETAAARVGRDERGRFRAEAGVSALSGQPA